MRKLLTLNKEGKLSLRAADGLEIEVRTSPRNVLLLIDTSGSMAGAKIEQARNGAIDFAHSAITKSYATALAIFADRAAMVCDPTSDAAHFAKKIARVDVGLVGGTTDLAAGLSLAGKFRELAAVVAVTDGQSDDNDAALEVAATLKTGVSTSSVSGLMTRTMVFLSDWQAVLTSRLTSPQRTYGLRLQTRVDSCRRDDDE